MHDAQACLVAGRVVRGRGVVADHGALISAGDEVARLIGGRAVRAAIGQVAGTGLICNCIPSAGGRAVRLRTGVLPGDVIALLSARSLRAAISAGA